MKIAIATLYGNNNYGNKLQNFALQYVLEKKFGCEVETIRNENNNIEIKISDLIRNKHTIKVLLSEKYKELKKIPIFANKKIEKFNLRESNITKFDKLIKKSKYKISRSNYNKISDSYDGFVIGSDQVWNPNFISNFDLNFLTFINSKKKFTYAASIGISSLTNEQKKFYTNMIRDFNIESISVREEKAKEILEELSDNKVEVVLDPTMLLTDHEWSELCKKPEYIKNSPYLLTYILGEVSEKRKKFINLVAKKYNLEIINILDTNSHAFCSGVDEFLWLFKNASLIFADSFHAGIFSIIFERPFYIMEREDIAQKMNSRFETLLKNFQLQNRFLEEYDIDNLDFNIDYKLVKNILTEKKKFSLKFIENNLIRIRKEN